MDDVNRCAAKLFDEKTGEAPREPFFPLEVAKIGDIVKDVPEVGDGDALVATCANAGETRLRLDYAYGVATRRERADEVKRAPAAPSAARRKRVGDDQHAHWFVAENAIPTRA